MNSGLVEKMKKVATHLFLKTHKRNLPKNYTTPKELKTYLSSVKSEITDPRNRNNIECNIPVEEVAALKELIRLQRERVIMVKLVIQVQG